MSDKFKLKYGYTNVILYFTLFLCMLFLNFTMPAFEPFSLALFVAMLVCGLNIWASAGLFLLAGGLSFSVSLLAFPVYAIAGVLFFAVFWFYNRAGKKPGAETVIFLAVALAPFLWIYAEYIYADIYRAAIVAIVIFILAFVFISALKCVLFKAGRCRLAAEELVFLSAAVVAVGTGFFNCAGGYAYDGAAILLVLIACAVLKNASAAYVALVLSIPRAIAMSVQAGAPDLSASAAFILYSAAALCFLRAGKLPAALALFLSDVFVRYARDFWSVGADAFVSSAFYLTMLTSLVPCFLFLLIPEFVYEKAANVLKLYSERQLTRLNINANRSATGEKLFEIAAVFKEIENTFISLDESGATAEDASQFICNKIAEDVCGRCANFERCRNEGMGESIQKLVSVGGGKGKVNLIDLPARLTAECVNPSGIMFTLNALLSEYRKSMLEAENASAGKRLLAEQARGVSTILKNLALEQSSPLSMNPDAERRIRDLVAKKGVVLNEIMVYGEDDLTLSLTVSGRHDLKKLVSAAEQVLGRRMTLSKKLPLAANKYCYVLKPKPAYDAAFGIASATKTGEIACGDTHSVIKIDERTFMLALSDGMGSGEYARRISDCTISLVESFYRAKMPSDTILSTVNQLLSFNREESFSCIDVATVDLDTGCADLVKIGSPLSFVLSENKIRVLESESLPLGILDSVKPTVLREALGAGDTVVLISDGITSAFSSSTDICAFMESVPCLNPQTFADELLKKAIDLCGGVAVDDMTVVAARIFESTD